LYKKTKMIKTKLKEARLNKEMSQEALADLIGMTQCNYSRRENGKKKISDAEWIKIAKALCISKEVIYEANIIITSQNRTVNIPCFNIPSFFIEDYELLKHENAVLKKKLKAFESKT
jgi:transcriptional regulator with XRE-family HTH domain